MDTSGVIQLVVLIILILLSGFFSSAETALSTVNRVRLRALEEEGSRRAVIANKVLDNYSKMLSTILIGNNIVNLSASALATTLALRIHLASYVILYFAIYNYRFVVDLIGAEPFALVIGFSIAMPIAITNIIPASMFADLAQYDTIMTGENRAGMFLAARNFANKLCQSIVVIACATLLGKGADGTGAATAEGVQATALVACIFVACALGIYFFYNDKEIADAIKESNNATK